MLPKAKAFFQRHITFSPKGNIYLLLIYRMALVMLLFTICRVLFYLFNTGYFPNITASHFFQILLGGMRFDALALVYVNALYIIGMLIPFKFRYNKIYQTVFKYLFVITNSIAIATNCFDIVYFRFTMRRTTATIFNEFGGEGNLWQLFGGFLVQYWYILLIFAAMVFILIRFYGKVQKPEFKSSVTYYAVGFVLFCIGGLFTFFGMRGHFGFHNRPITLSNASQYVKEPIEMPLVQSTPFALLKTSTRNQMPIFRYYSEEELNQIYTPEKNYQPNAPFRYKNVVILILESFGGEYVKHGNIDVKNHVSYTPFLDSLMEHSRTFTYSFANGRKSIDAMPSVLASIPAIYEPYVLSPYSGNYINGIAGVLRKEGYETSFFHNAYNGAMGFSGIANLTGFEHYYGMTEYKNTVNPTDNSYYDGIAGVFDEDFFQFYAQEMNGMKQPFCTALFSLSSHTPFTIPAKYKDIFKGDPDAFRSSLRYSDYSLRRFFETASKMPWFENTLFVLSADHGGIYSMTDEYQTSVGVFAIPIVFYCPGDTSLVGRQDRLAQQMDILPSILAYLNYQGQLVAFGNNLFNNAPEYIDSCFVAQYVGNALQLIMGDYLIHFDGERLLSIYRFKEDIFLKNNLLGTLPDVERKMEEKAKAFFQQYTTRLKENRLTTGRNNKTFSNQI